MTYLSYNHSKKNGRNSILKMQYYQVDTNILYPYQNFKSHLKCVCACDKIGKNSNKYIE